MTDERRAWLILSLARVGGATLDALLGEHGSAPAICRLDNRSLAAAGLGERAIAAVRRPDEAALNAALAVSDGEDAHLLHAGHDAYPPLLRQIRDWPPLLYVRGNPDALSLPAIAIVGSRNPTRGGEDNAFAFARHLGSCGFAVVSGLAQGIDTAAHRGALAAPAVTVAVLGHGIDRVYPATNRELADRIAADGALLTEYPPGTPPRREHFPARNRLISGLALGALVVEAAYRSGSLITARLAAEQGREVFAIPGSIHNPLARGCHRLIREGAKLIEDAADILDELAPLVGHLMQHKPDETTAAAPPPERDADYVKLLDALAFEPLSADDLAAKSGLTIDQVSSMLLILELEGQIEVMQGGRYARLRTS